MQIDHDPHEPPPDRSGNASTWGLIILFFICCAGLIWLRYPFDWLSGLMGGFAVFLVVSVGHKLTGDRLPDWWPR